MPDAKPDLGSKFTCFKCACKFYDLGAEVPLCPRCGADQREDPNPDPREAFLARYRRPASRKRSAPKKKNEPMPSIDDDEDEDVDEDDDLLDDDFDKDE